MLVSQLFLIEDKDAVILQCMDWSFKTVAEIDSTSLIVSLPFLKSHLKGQA